MRPQALRLREARLFGDRIAIVITVGDSFGLLT